MNGDGGGGCRVLVPKLKFIGTYTTGGVGRLLTLTSLWVPFVRREITNLVFKVTFLAFWVQISIYLLTPTSFSYSIAGINSG